MAKVAETATGARVNLGPKNAALIASTRREQSAVFFSLSSTTLNFEKHAGRINPPPLPARLRYENRHARATVKVHARNKKCSWSRMTMPVI